MVGWLFDLTVNFYNGIWQQTMHHRRTGCKGKEASGYDSHIFDVKQGSDILAKG
jgi:hypothetical protein